MLMKIFCWRHLKLSQRVTLIFRQSWLPCNFYVALEETNVVIRKHENKIRIMIFDDGEGIALAKADGTLPYIEGQTHFGMTGNVNLTSFKLNNIIVINLMAIK